MDTITRTPQQTDTIRRIAKKARTFRTIKTRDGEVFQPVTRWTRIKMYQPVKNRNNRFYDIADTDPDTGEKYVDTFQINGTRGMKFALQEVLKLSYLIFFDTPDGKTDFLSGYIPISNTLAFLVQIDESGEYIRLFREIDPEE